MIRKELNSQNQYESGLALTSLSCYISTDLARDLSNDILTLVFYTILYFVFLYKQYLLYSLVLRNRIFVKKRF